MKFASAGWFDRTTLPGTNPRATALVPRVSITLDGWWRFDDKVRGVAKDDSGNGNDGTVTPAAQHVPGYFGSAVSLDATPRALTCPTTRHSNLRPRSS